MLLRQLGRLTSCCPLTTAGRAGIACVVPTCFYIKKKLQTQTQRTGNTSVREREMRLQRSENVASLASGAGLLKREERCDLGQ